MQGNIIPPNTQQGFNFTLSACKIKTLKAKGVNIIHLFYKTGDKGILNRWKKASSKHRPNLPLLQNKYIHIIFKGKLWQPCWLVQFMWQHSLFPCSVLHTENKAIKWEN